MSSKLREDGVFSLANKISDIEQMTGEQIYQILDQDYSILLGNIDDPKYKEIRKNSRILTILSQVLIEKKLSSTEVIKCNSMIYKELGETDNLYMQRIYYILGLIVNQTMVQKFMHIGLNKGLSIYFAVIRKSSLSNKDNICRLNFSIMSASPQLMTIQMITNIYCAVFDTVSDIKDLFLITMMDTSVFSNDMEEQPWITPDTLQVAHNMNYAILSILESLPADKLSKILSEYSNMILIEDLKEEDVRFSFKSIDPKQFPNIYDAQQGTDLL